MMSYIILFMMALAFADDRNLKEMQKKSVQETLKKFQEKIRPGRLSPEQKERLDKMTETGRYVRMKPVPELTDTEKNVLKSKLETSENRVNAPIAITPKNDDYERFTAAITGITDPIEATAPATTSLPTIASKSQLPIVPSLPAIESPPEVVKVDENERVLKGLYAQMDSRTVVTGPSDDIFNLHSKAYKKVIIPKLIQLIKPSE